jgi:glycerol-1-phosphate dehydrogenase [NAD(P)+]
MDRQWTRQSISGLQLGGSFECRCGQTHEVPVRSFCYQDAALDEVDEIVTDALGRPLGKSVVVADARTWRICGKKAAEQLNAEPLIVPDSSRSGPVCDDYTCLWLKQQIGRTAPQLIFAVGSGTINDLCKWAAFEMNLPYAVAATAASMNGYAAANVAAKVSGIKMVLRARAPVAVLAEPAIIEQAPAEMTAAGFADTVAKFLSKADWVLNNLLFGEYYCGYCADILNNIQGSYLDRPEKLRTADPQTIKGLFEALFLTGIAMTMVGASTPASGGEHLLSHTLDMTADIDNQGQSLHGLQVGLGTIVSAALYEKILAIDQPTVHDIPKDIDTTYWRNERLIESVKEQYTSKQGFIKTAAGKITQPQIWEQLRNKSQPLAKPPTAVKDLLQRAGAADDINDLGFSRRRIKQALLHMHEIRKRFTVVDLAWLTGVLPVAVNEIIDAYLLK